MVETEGTHTAGFIGSDFEAGTVAQTPLGHTSNAAVSRLVLDHGA